MMFHENRLPADDSHETSYLICYFPKGGKILNCRLLQIIGGALRVRSMLTISAVCGVVICGSPVSRRAMSCSVNVLGGWCEPGPVVRGNIQ